MRSTVTWGSCRAFDVDACAYGRQRIALVEVGSAASYDVNVGLTSGAAASAVAEQGGDEARRICGSSAKLSEALRHGGPGNHVLILLREP
jgi:hypothetical protein